MTDIAARLRILDELDAEACALWGEDVGRLTPDEYAQCLLCLAADRIQRNEVRGFSRQASADTSDCVGYDQDQAWN